MDSHTEVLSKVLTRLNERVKELECIYSVEEMLRDKEKDVDSIMNDLLHLIPPGWQYPTICVARITLDDKVYTGPDFVETEWKQSADIIIDDSVIGCIEVFYTQMIRLINNSQFLPEEQRLLNTISDRVSNFIFSRKLRTTLQYLRTKETTKVQDEQIRDMLPMGSDEHWKWRLHFADLIAHALDFEKFGVEAVYVIGSTKNAIAGPASDIDLIIHFNGDVQQRRELSMWIEGWGLALAELNYQKTGYRSGSMIDMHLVTDADISNKTSYAVMIGSVSDGARLLRKK